METHVPQTLRIEREPGVLHVLLDRPEVRNAMSQAMVRELHDALHAAESDGATRIVVLRGAGGHFCAGADLRDMAAARARLQDDPEAIASINAEFGRLCIAFAHTPLVVIAVLEGTVMGGGLGLACAADVALAHVGAAFRLPETSLGVPPAQIAPLLVERMGYSQAKRLAVTGGQLDAASALAVGLVHEVHDDAQLDAALRRVIAQTLGCAPRAIATTKTLMRDARLRPPESLIEAAAQAFSRAALGEEGIEGATAFLQKRKPTWAPA